MRAIACDLSRIRGPLSRCASRVVGAGLASEILRASFRQQLARAVEEGGSVISRACASRPGSPTASCIAWDRKS